MSIVQMKCAYTYALLTLTLDIFRFPPLSSEFK